VYTYLLKLENFCRGFQSMANFVALLSHLSLHSMMTMEGCENSSTEDNLKYFECNFFAREFCILSHAFDFWAPYRYYSMYGHVLSLAKKVKEGADSVEGVEAVLYQVPETLSPEVLEKMSAPAKDKSIPIISPAELADADGIIFGFPTRYGSMSAQMKAFFDSTGALWQTQALVGKPAGIFVSTGSQGGGQETTA